MTSSKRKGKTRINSHCFSNHETKRFCINMSLTFEKDFGSQLVGAYGWHGRY